MGLPSRFVFIIGAPKSGTTSLAEWLNARPDMAYCAGKEPRFFTDFADQSWTGPDAKAFLSSMYTDEAAYLAGFPDDPEVTWAIDGSTDYLWCDASPALLKDWSARYPSKLICMLRDPVDRAISEYQHTLRDSLETGSFQEALAAEDARYEEGWQPLFYHRRRSLYAEAVARYRAVFGDDLLVLDYHELRDPETCLKKVTDFLGVPYQMTIRNERQNISYVYSNPTVGKAMNSKGLRAMARAIFPPALRSRIRGFVTRRATTKFRATDQDRQAIHALLAEDIAACRADAGIPTANWTAP